LDRVQLRPVNVHGGLREIGEAARVIEIEVRHDDVPDVGTREAERLDLPGDRLVENRVRLPDELPPHPDFRPDQSLLAVTGVDQSQPGGVLEQQAVTRSGGLAPHARPAVEQTATERTSPPASK
jgi:hypothetical protein